MGCPDAVESDEAESDESDDEQATSRPDTAKTAIELATTWRLLGVLPARAVSAMG